MCFCFSHPDTFESPFGVRRPSIRLRNLQENKNKILMEALREFDIAINRAGVSSATAANQGVPSSSTRDDHRAQDQTGSDGTNPCERDETRGLEPLIVEDSGGEK